MDLLPPAGVRPTLLDALALVIRRRGYETFVRAPILEPTSRYFPDPWEATERGVRVLSLRLLAYAGLEDLDAVVEIDRQGYLLEAAGLGEHRHDGAAAWFAGIHDETCVFGADRRQLDEADAIVGTMCHEIAHAYREAHAITSTTRQIDEEHTDITTIYLGFGVLTVNNAYRFRKSGDLRTTRWETSLTGYLSLQAMAYLFAAQCVARGLPEAETSRLGKLLEANQRGCFEAAQRDLSGDVEGLRLRLGVPPEDEWPPEVAFELPELGDDAPFAPEDDDDVRRAELAGRNAGRSVWRIASTSSARFAVAGSAAACLAGVALGRLAGDAITGVAIGSAVLGAAAGAWLGRRRVRYACSDPACGAAFPSGTAERCPKCGGSALGTLDDEKDRLEVEETRAAGRSVEDLRRTLAARRERGAKRGIGVFVLFGLAVAGLMVVAALPTSVTIDAAIHDPSLRQSKVILAGDVTEERVGTTALVGHDGTELVPFELKDGTGTIVVWYAPSALPAALHRGDRVQATGQQFLIEGAHDDEPHFMASAVKRER